MDLKDFLSVGGVKNKNYYWALVIEPGLVQAGVWEIIEDKAQVVATSAPAPWESDGELVGAADAALSSSLQSLPEDIKEPSKTVFGVPPSWVDKGEIKEEYLSKIKSVCTDLSLEPTGFVVLPEAISHLAKVEEGAPLNAAVVGMGKDFLEVTVFKLGNLVGMTAVSRSVSVFEDLIEGLSRFSAIDALPSRIIIYDGKEGELEDAKQTLIGSNWEAVEKIKFFHTPKIEIFPSEKKVLATALAGASEMAGVVGLIENKEEPKTEPVAEEHHNLVTPVGSPTPQELGFVVGEDVASKMINQVPQQQTVQNRPTVQQPQYNQAPAAPHKVAKKNIFAGILVKVQTLINSFKTRLPKPEKTFQSPPLKRKNYILMGGVGLVFLLGFVAFWWFYPKAQITIYVSPKKFEEKTDIVVDSSGVSTDIVKKIIAAEIVTEEVSGEKTKNTTGTRKIGDKAKGSVNIQNGTDKVLNLSEGTVIAAANGLKFTVSSSASVSAALSPSNPGTKVVEVTAYDIGAEYNLAKDERFQVGSYSKADIDAVATADFTGGSSRDISAVSADDAKVLLDSLTSELGQSAKKNILENVSDESVFIESSLVATPSAKTFSSKVGDEATNLKLSLKIKATGLVVKRADLVAIAREILKNSSPAGFSLNDQGIAYEFSLIKASSKASTFNLKVIANYLPSLDVPSLIKEISGKSSGIVKTRLNQIAGFDRAEISIKPKFPGILGTLPRISKNIVVEVVGER